MELNENRTPARADFMAATDTRIVSAHGDMCMNFKAGETRGVPREMFPAAIAAGLVPIDSLEIPEEPKEPVMKQSKEETIESGLLEACKLLIARGNPADFTQVGLPRAASIKKLVNFDFNGQQAKRAFELAMFEVENDGDEGTEPAESSGSTTE